MPLMFKVTAQRRWLLLATAGWCGVHASLPSFWVHACMAVGCAPCERAEALRGWHKLAHRLVQSPLHAPPAPHPQVVILSPHGYFGQTNVLGMPDTGGQARAMPLVDPQGEVAMLGGGSGLRAEVM